ncbi:hypothetical protein [Synechococcus sp. UW140]|uniref:hypothetical protein n=1 Tax=Synechococcus sp. UW140 TaxID=368503 RepID=UPI0025D785F1|nr:hypothetical protein [Synechococcus sp. UW140]
MLQPPQRLIDGSALLLEGSDLTVSMRWIDLRGALPYCLYAVSGSTDPKPTALEVNPQAS